MSLPLILLFAVARKGAASKRQKILFSEAEDAILFSIRDQKFYKSKDGSIKEIASSYRDKFYKVCEELYIFCTTD